MPTHGDHGDHAGGVQERHERHSVAGAHDRHEGHSVAMFRDRFWLSLVLTIPTVLLSPEVADWLGYTIPADVPAEPKR